MLEESLHRSYRHPHVLLSLATFIGFMDIQSNVHVFVSKSKFIERLSQAQPPSTDSTIHKLRLVFPRIPNEPCGEKLCTYRYAFWYRSAFLNQTLSFGLSFGSIFSGTMIHEVVRENKPYWIMPCKRYKDISVEMLDSLMKYAPYSVSTLQNEDDINIAKSGRIRILPNPSGYEIPSRAMYIIAEVKVIHDLKRKLPSLPDIWRKRGFTLGYRLYDENKRLLSEDSFSTLIEHDLYSGEETGVYVHRPKDKRVRWIQFGLVLLDGEFLPLGELAPLKIHWTPYDYLIQAIGE